MLQFQIVPLGPVNVQILENEVIIPDKLKGDQHLPIPEGFPPLQQDDAPLAILCHM